MKKSISRNLFGRFFPFVLILVLSGELFGQTDSKIRVEQILSFGLSLPAGLPSGITNAGASNLKVGFVLRKLVFDKNFFLKTGLVYRWQKYFVDGYFNNEGGGATKFSITPPDFKQNTVYFESVEMPLMIKGYFENQGIGFGLVGSYITRSHEWYKINVQEFDVDAYTINRLQLAAQLEIEFKIPFKKSYISIGFDGQYQLTSFLSSRSFSPFIAEFNIISPIL
jgi:hypothetical protein